MATDSSEDSATITAATFTPKRSRSIDSEQSSDSKRRRLSEDEPLLIEDLGQEPAEEPFASDSVIMHTIDNDHTETLPNPSSTRIMSFLTFLASVRDTTSYLDKDDFMRMASSIDGIVRHLSCLTSPVDKAFCLFSTYALETQILAQVLSHILEVDDPFRTPERKSDDVPFREALQLFCANAIDLAYCVIAHLTLLLDSKIQRSLHCDLNLVLLWPRVAWTLTNKQGNFLNDVSKHHGLRYEHIDRAVSDAYKHNSSLPQRLDGLLLRLANTDNHTLHSLTCMLPLMAIINTKLNVHEKQAAISGTNSETNSFSRLLSALHDKFFGVLAASNPRSVHSGFHAKILPAIVSVITSTMQLMMEDEVQAAVIQTSQLFAIEEVVLPMLAELRKGNLVVLCKYLWQLKLAVIYLKADFMSLRIFATMQLSETVLSARKAYKVDRSRRNDIFLQLVRRILEHLAVVPYLFRKQWYIRLLGQSQDLITFLVSTGGWSTELADLIWTAFLGNGEDEFLKTTYSVLREVCNALTAQDLLYLLKKYEQMPLNDILSYPIRLFPHLLEQLCTHSDQSWRCSDALTHTTELSLSMLVAISPCERNAEVAQLQHALLKHILQPVVQIERVLEQQAICQRCADFIAKHTPEADVGYSILTYYLKRLEMKSTSLENVCTLTLTDILHEIESWIASSETLKTDRGFQLRFNLLAVMVSLRAGWESPLVLESRFSAIISSSTISVEEQQRILDIVLTCVAEPSQAWSNLIARHLSILLPQINADTTSTNLRCYLGQCVMRMPATGLLDEPFWKQLLRLILATPHTWIWERTRSLLCSILMKKTPEIPGRSYHKLVTLQRAFIRQCVDNLSQLPRLASPSEQRVSITRTFALLQDLLKQDEEGGVIKDSLLGQYDVLVRMLQCNDDVALHTAALLQSLPITADMNEDYQALDSDRLTAVLHDQPWRIVHCTSLLAQKVNEASIDGKIKISSILIDVLLHGNAQTQEAVVHAIAIHANQCLASLIALDAQAAIGNLLGDKLKCLFTHLIRLMHSKLLPSEQGQEHHIPWAVPELYSSIFHACQLHHPAWTAVIEADDFVNMHKHLTNHSEPTLFGNFVSPLINAVQIAPVEVLKTYIGTMVLLFGGAMHRSSTVKGFFEIIKQLLHHITSPIASTGVVDEWMPTIGRQLCHWQHKETTYNRLADEALDALLKTAICLINYLISNGRPMPLDLGEKLWELLLFPSALPLTVPQRQPLLNTNTRSSCYEVVYLLCGSEAEREHQTIRMQQQIDTSWPDSAVNLGQRLPHMPAGLTNLGMTCYMNSLLQQIFGNLSFRKSILGLTIVDGEKQKVLVAVQKLFADMQETVYKSVDTTALASIMNIRTSDQDDVHAFYSILMVALEENIAIPDEKERFTKLYTGKTISQVRGTCGHISTSVEDLNGLSVTVQNKDCLESSLAEYFQPEHLRGDNQYKCLTCQSPGDQGCLVEAYKRSILSEVPDTLTFCLKRCEYGGSGLERKNNDAFDFREHLNMAPYQNKSAEDHQHSDVFLLVGVIVHQGSLEFGHYWSYTRQRAALNDASTAWLRLEDSRTIAASYEQMRAECVGGETNSSAYMLFYEREQAYEHDEALTEPDSPLCEYADYLLPRVAIPAAYVADIIKDNTRAVQISNVFDPSTRMFVTASAEKLLEFFVKRSSTITNDTDLTDNGVLLIAEPDTTSASEAQMVKYCSSAVSLLASYISEVLLRRADNQALRTLIAQLKLFVYHQPGIATDVLALFQIPSTVQRMLRCDCSTIQQELHGLLWSCFDMISQKAHDKYQEAYEKVLSSYEGLITSHAIDYMPDQWSLYTCRIQLVAERGDAELNAVVNRKFLRWIADVLQASCSKKVYIADRVVIKASLSHLHVLYKALYRLLVRVTAGTQEQRLQWHEKIKFLWQPVDGQETTYLDWLRPATHSEWHFAFLQDFAPRQIIVHLLRLSDVQYTELITNTLIDALVVGNFHLDSTGNLVTTFVVCCKDFDTAVNMLERHISTTAGEDKSGAESVAVMECLENVCRVKPDILVDTLESWIWWYGGSSTRLRQSAFTLLDAILDNGSPLDPGDAHNVAAVSTRRIKKVLILLRTFPRKQGEDQVIRVSKYNRLVVERLIRFATELYGYVSEMCEAAASEGNGFETVMSSAVGQLIRSIDEEREHAETVLAPGYWQTQQNAYTSYPLSEEYVETDDDGDDLEDEEDFEEVDEGEDDLEDAANDISCSSS